MIASLLSPTAATPPAQGRMSQLLPSVKCSTCHQPVPLSELGDHTCAPPPPSPGPIPPPKPLSSNASLLPERLQGRLASPANPSPSSSNTPVARPGSTPPRQPPQPPPQHQRMQSSASARLRINTRSPNSPTQPTFQPKPSPLARSGSEDNRNENSPPKSRDPPLPSNPSSSPSRTRTRTPSNAGSTHSTPSTARPPVLFNQETTPTQAPPRNGTPLSNPPIRGPGLPTNPSRSVPPRIGTPGSINGGPPSQMKGPPPTAMRGLPAPQTNPPPPPMMNAPTSNAVPFPRGLPPPSGQIPIPLGSAGRYPPRPGPPGSMSLPNGVGPPTTIGPRAMGPPGGMRPRLASMDQGPIPMRPEEAFVPAAERGIDTKSGGEAGMAGVGRRGFAAAARAAMFVNPNLPQPQYGRRPNAPQFLDIDVASRCEFMKRFVYPLLGVTDHQLPI